jgi:hypothetical protein
MGSPLVTPWLLSQSHFCCGSPQVPCLSGALALVSDDEVPTPCTDNQYPRPSDHAAAASLLGSACEVPNPQFPPSSAFVRQ